VKGTKILAALAAVLAIMLSGCGGAAIGDLKTITLSASPSSNIKGEGGTIQFQAVGIYSTGQQRDLTNRVTFNVTISAGSTDVNGAALPTPPQAILVNSTGLATAVPPFVCTWTDTNPGATTATWAITGSYQVLATFGSVTSQPLFVSVASATGNGPGGACGPS
jgi:hypothetical protein